MDDKHISPVKMHPYIVPECRRCGTPPPPPPPPPQKKKKKKASWLTTLVSNVIPNFPKRGLKILPWNSDKSLVIVQSQNRDAASEYRK